METVVRPALECNVAAVPEKMADVIAILAGSEANEEDHANLKIACAALMGQLSSHPLIQGLTLQCRRLIDKTERGISTMPREFLDKGTSRFQAVCIISRRLPFPGACFPRGKVTVWWANWNRWVATLAKSSRRCTPLAIANLMIHTRSGCTSTRQTRATGH